MISNNLLISNSAFTHPPKKQCCWLKMSVHHSHNRLSSNQNITLSWRYISFQPQYTDQTYESIWTCTQCSKTEARFFSVSANKFRFYLCNRFPNYFCIISRNFPFSYLMYLIIKYIYIRLLYLIATYFVHIMLFIIDHECFLY